MFVCVHGVNIDSCTCKRIYRDTTCTVGAPRPNTTHTPRKDNVYALRPSGMLRTSKICRLYWRDDHVNRE